MFEQPERKKADRDFTLYLPKNQKIYLSKSSKKQNSPNNLFTEKKFKLSRFGSPASRLYEPFYHSGFVVISVITDAANSKSALSHIKPNLLFKSSKSIKCADTSVTYASPSISRSFSGYSSVLS